MLLSASVYGDRSQADALLQHAAEVTGVSAKLTAAQSAAGVGGTGPTAGPPGTESPGTDAPGTDIPTSSAVPAVAHLPQQLTLEVAGGSIDITLYARDHITDCAAHAYGQQLVAFFHAHPCAHADRALLQTTENGRPVALSIISVDEPAPSGDPYQNTDRLRALENADGTGGVNDLLKEGHRPPGWPASIPGTEAFTVSGQDAVAEIYDAFYLDGPTTGQDTDLVDLSQSLVVFDQMLFRQ